MPIPSPAYYDTLLLDKLKFVLARAVQAQNSSAKLHHGHTLNRTSVDTFIRDLDVHDPLTNRAVALILAETTARKPPRRRTAAAAAAASTSSLPVERAGRAEARLAAISRTLPSFPHDHIHRPHTGGAGARERAWAHSNLVPAHITAEYPVPSASSARSPDDDLDEQADLENEAMSSSFVERLLDLTPDSAEDDGGAWAAAQERERREGFLSFSEEGRRVGRVQSERERERERRRRREAPAAGSSAGSNAQASTSATLPPRPRPFLIRPRDPVVPPSPAPITEPTPSSSTPTVAAAPSASNEPETSASIAESFAALAASRRPIVPLPTSRTRAPTTTTPDDTALSPSSSLSRRNAHRRARIDRGRLELPNSESSSTLQSMINSLFDEHQEREIFDFVDDQVNSHPRAQLRDPALEMDFVPETDLSDYEGPDPLMGGLVAEGTDAEEEEDEDDAMMDQMLERAERLERMSQHYEYPAAVAAAARLGLGRSNRVF